MNIYLDPDDQILHYILRVIGSYGHANVLVDHDGVVHAGPDTMERIDQLMAAHPEYLVGRYTGTACRFSIVRDITARKAEMLDAAIVKTAKRGL